MVLNVHSVLFGFGNILASHLERLVFKQRDAILLRLLVLGYPSLSNPFDGEKVLMTFSFIRLIHSVD